MGLLDGILGAVLAGQSGGQQHSMPTQRQSLPQSAGGADPLDGLLGAILGGNPAVQQHAQQQGVSIDDILGSIAGGGQTSAPQMPSAPQGQGGMGDILGSILGGAMGGQTQQQQLPSTGQGGMGDILGSILGGAMGGQTQQQPLPSSGQGGMGDILGSILGGAMGGQTQQQQMPSSGQGGMGDILGSILGGAMGGQTQQQQMPSSGQGGMGDILGSILGGAMGGQTQQPQMPSTGQGGLGPLGSILGAVIGGGAAGGGDLKSIGISVAANAFLAPIVNKIAAKLGLPPSVAQAIVAFAVQKLVLGATQQRAQTSAGSVAQPQAGAGPNINDILQSLGQGQRVDRRTIKQLGLADELAANTDIDPSTAARGLQAVFDEFSGPMTTTEQPDYSSLLQKWVPS